MPSARLCLLVLVAGCGPSELGIRVDKPWASDAPGVLTAIAEADGALIAPTPTVIAPGQRLELSFGEAAFELRLAEFAAEDAPGLVECGVRLGGDRQALPRPKGTWRSRFDPDSGPETLAPSPDPGTDLRYDQCEPASACAGITLDFWVLPLPGLNVIQVEWIPRNHWVVGLRASDSAESHLGILTPTGDFTELGTGFDTRIYGIAWDRADRVYVSLEDGRLWAINLQAEPELVEVPSPGFGGSLVSRPDGLVVLHARGGRARVVSQPITGAIDGDDFPPAIDRLEMASSTEMAVINGLEVLLWDQASLAWIPQGRLPVIDTDTSLVFFAGTLGVFAKTFAYLYKNGEQTALPAPTDVANPTSATHFNDGALVFGGVGGAAYWKRGRWCPLGTPGVASAFRAAASSPDGKLAASGSDPDSTVGPPKVLVWH